MQVLIFVLGLVVGSFLNVLIYRVPRNLPLSGRSFCPKCHKHLLWHDNIPLVSFVVLCGKCRFCKERISLRYPIVELLTGTLFVAIAIQKQLVLVSILSSIVTFYWLFIIATLIVIFFIDLEHGIIPDKITYLAIVITAMYLFIIHDSLFMIHLGSALGAVSFLLLLNLITRGRGMGLGDVKLAALMGLILGFPKIILALYCAFLTGAAISIILILAGNKRFGDSIPFGPFLVFGTMFALFFAEKVFSYLAI